MSITKYRIPIAGGYTEFPSLPDAQAYVAANLIDPNSITTVTETPVVDVGVAKQVVLARMDFSIGLIAQWAAENRLMGITVSQSLTVFSYFCNILVALQIGALETAIALIKGLPPESRDGRFITDARLLQYVNLCEDYLGIPRSLSIQS